MRITALEPQRNHTERVNVFVDGEFRCGLAAEIVYGAGLGVGAEVWEALLGELEQRDLRWKAREAALRLLAYRPRTEEELRRRLRRKDYPEPVVEACVAELVQRGFVDDDAFAAAFIRDRVRSRPRGTRRLVQELCARGVENQAARRLVDRTLQREQVTELDLAREAAEAWARRAATGRATGTDDRWRDRRRLYGYLARRGFGADAIRAAMAEVLVEAYD